MNNWKSDDGKGKPPARLVMLRTRWLPLLQGLIYALQESFWLLYQGETIGALAETSYMVFIIFQHKIMVTCIKNISV
jgi:hypothetical protein